MMLAASFRAVFILAICYVLYVNAGFLLGLISADPVVAVRVLVIVYASATALRLMLRLLRPQRAVVAWSAAPVSVAPARLGEGAIAAAAGSFNRTRRAHHEAAHAILALRLGKENIAADIMLHANLGDRVTYETSGRSLVDATYDDMLIGFAGHIVDTERGHFDGGSRNDMRMLTEDALLILSTGLHPERFTGDLTLESLVRAAREDSERMLEESAGAVALVAAALERDGRLSATDLLAVVGDTAATR